MDVGRKIKGLFSYKKIFVLALVLLAGTVGCIQIIDFNVNRQGNRLVVEGIITDKGGPYFLQLRQTSSEEKITDPVSDADIKIFDDLGNSEQYTQYEKGKYFLAGYDVKGIPGHSYYIEITLPDGSHYQSEPEKIPLSIAKDSVYYKFDTVTEQGSSNEKDVLKVFADTRIPQSTSGDHLYLRWNVEEAYKFTEFDFPDPLNIPPPVCYVTDDPDPQTILLYDGQSLDSQNINGQTLIVRELDDSFFQRHYINVIQYSISRGAHEYWTQVDQVVNSSGTIFDVPPATAEGNVYNTADSSQKALGYFEATRVDTSRFFLVHADIPYYITNPCDNTYRHECTNCTLLDNSSHEPPFYWLKD